MGLKYTPRDTREMTAKAVGSYSQNDPNKDKLQPKYVLKTESQLMLNAEAFNKDGGPDRPFDNGGRPGGGIRNRKIKK